MIISRPWLSLSVPDTFHSFTKRGRCGLVVMLLWPLSVDGDQESVDFWPPSVDCSFQSADSWRKSVDSRRKSMDSWLQSVDSRLQSMDSWLQSMDCSLQSVDSSWQSVDAGAESVDFSRGAKGCWDERRCAEKDSSRWKLERVVRAAQTRRAGTGMVCCAIDALISGNLLTRSKVESGCYHQRIHPAA